MALNEFDVDFTPLFGGVEKPKKAVKTLFLFEEHPDDRRSSASSKRIE